MRLQPNILVKQRNLKLVTSKGKYYDKNGSLGRLLKGIKRYSVENRILICAVVSPDNSKGVFLDDKGHEYLITSKDLNSDLTYISSKFVKKKDKKFAGVRYQSSKYNSIVKKFLQRPDIQQKYKGWSSGNGLQPSIQINEENNSMYEVGKHYIADNGDWSFKVESYKDGVYVIKDLSSGKKYKVEASDLELTNANVDEEDLDESRGDGITPQVRKIIRTLSTKVENLYAGAGDIHDIAVTLKKYGRDYTEKGGPDRPYLDSIIADAKKIYNYYLLSVKPRLKDIDLNEYEKESIDEMISIVNSIRNIDPDTVDLDELKNQF